jgi:hypothetical protein
MKEKFQLIATAKDGGSKLFQYEGNTYFLDYGISSETRGVIFHGKDKTGMAVNEFLHKEIAPYFPSMALKESWMLMDHVLGPGKDEKLPGFDNGAMSYTEGMQAGSGIVENWKSRAKAHLSEGKSRCELELFVDKYFGINAVDETHPITTDYGQLVNLLAMFKEEQLDAANKRIAELEEWKRQELELTQPIIGYCQNDENAKRLGIAKGSSIFKRVLEILKEYNGSNNRIKELEDLIQSDSVYTLLRFGSKSPSGSGMDDCEDDSYIDLYNISKELRTIDATKTGNHG